VEFRRQCGKMFDLTSHVFLAYIEVHTHIHVHTKTQAHTYTHTHTHTQKLMHIFALHITYQVEITCHMKHFWKRVGQIRANHELLAFVAWQGKKNWLNLECNCCLHSQRYRQHGGSPGVHSRRRISVGALSENPIWPFAGKIDRNEVVRCAPWVPHQAVTLRVND